METTSQWYKRARTAWEPAIFLEMRFRTPWEDDELATSIEHARTWLAMNPCPNLDINRHFNAMFDAYAEMSKATVQGVMDLRKVIEQHSEAVELLRDVDEVPRISLH